MTARFIKETRDQLPLLVASILFIVCPYLIWQQDAGVFGFISFGLGCAVLAGSSFGSEFQHRTWSLLLSLPVPRRSVWLEKMLVLAACIAATLFVVCACFAVFFRSALTGDGLITLWLIMLCALCGTPYWTLKCRSAIAGVVFSIAVPGLLVVFTAFAGEYWLRQLRPETSLPPLLMLYSAVCGWRGYANFKTLQILDGAPVEFELPQSIRKVPARWQQAFTAENPGPVRSLVQKELRIQQMAFGVALLFFLIAVAGFVLSWRRPEWAEWIFGADYFLYVPLLPLLIGALAAAEETAWGVTEWQATLPISSARQWCVKMLVTLTVSLVLGLLLPAGLLLLGGTLHTPGTGAPALPSVRVIAVLILAHLLLTSLAAYCGSLCNSTLKAILLAFGAALAVAFCMHTTIRILGSLPPDLITRSFERQNWFIAGTALLVLLALVQRFAFANHRERVVGWRRILVQALILAVTTALFTANFVMH